MGRTGRVHRVLTPAAPLLLVLFHPQTRVPAAASGSHAPPPAVLRLLGLTTPEEAVPWPVVRALLVTAAAHQGGDGDRAWDDQLRRAIARAREPLPPLSELLTDSEDVGRGEQPSWSNSSSSSSEEAWSLPSPVPSADTPAAVEHAQHSPLDSRVDASVGEEEEDGAEVEDEASSSSVDDGAVAAAAAPEPQTLAEQPSERGQTSPAAGAPIHVGSEYEADARTPASIGAERWSSDGGEGSSWSPVEWWSPPRTPQPWPQLDSEGDDAEEDEGVEEEEPAAAATTQASEDSSSSWQPPPPSSPVSSMDRATEERQQEGSPAVAQPSAVAEDDAVAPQAQASAKHTSKEKAPMPGSLDQVEASDGEEEGQSAVEEQEEKEATAADKGKREQVGPSDTAEDASAAGAATEEEEEEDPDPSTELSPRAPTDEEALCGGLVRLPPQDYDRARHYTKRFALRPGDQSAVLKRQLAALERRTRRRCGEVTRAKRVERVLVRVRGAEGEGGAYGRMGFVCVCVRALSNDRRPLVPPTSLLLAHTRTRHRAPLLPPPRPVLLGLFGSVQVRALTRPPDAGGVPRVARL